MHVLSESSMLVLNLERCSLIKWFFFQFLPYLSHFHILKSYPGMFS